MWLAISLGIAVALSFTGCNPSPTKSSPEQDATTATNATTLATGPVTHTAFSCAAIDIKAAINGGTDSDGHVFTALNDGDICIVPAGDAVWSGPSTTTQIIVTKGITIRGQTVVEGDHLTPFTPPAKTGIVATDVTILEDDLTIANNNAILFDVRLVAGQDFRMTGITIKRHEGGRTTKPANAAAVKVSGVVGGGRTNGSARIDHCHFDGLYQLDSLNEGWITWMVYDHCKFDADGTQGGITSNNGKTWNGGDYGDGSWAAPSNYGSGSAVYVEDCDLDYHGNVQTGLVVGGQNGERLVFRYNRLHSCVLVSGHGTESGGRFTGQRLVEIYGNIVDGNLQSLGITRSGCLLLHDNILNVTTSGLNFPLTSQREDFPYPTYGGANGNDPWDANDTEGDGSYVEGHAPHLYASGVFDGQAETATTGATGVLTMVADPNWSPDAYKGMMLSNNTKATTGGGKHPASIINGNTNNSITFHRNSPDPPTPADLKSFSPGDSFSIYNLLVCLDQPGRGQRDLVTGFLPINTVTNSATWPHQKLEPVYAWGNRKNGAQVDVQSQGYPTMKEGRDYYNENQSFDGTSGIGVGPLSARPATCTGGTDITGVTPNAPGVAWWATDKNTLSVCKGSAWVDYYTPFVYPHPLASGLAMPTPTPGTSPTPQASPARSPTPAATLSPRPSPSPMATATATATISPHQTSTPSPAKSPTLTNRTPPPTL